MPADSRASRGSRKTALPSDPQQIIQANWKRYEYVRSRGHTDYCNDATRNEDFYLGGGLQWQAEVAEALEAQGRPAVEINQIIGAVNAACGYQVANRMEATYVPVGHDGDDVIAKALTMTLKSELTREKFRWKETDVFADGLIQQRGYFDLRIRADENMQGSIALSTHDPRDVIPDPDAKSYDPDDWADVTVTRWLTADEIDERYGAKARTALEDSGEPPASDFGESEIGNSDYGDTRSRFGDPSDAGNFDARVDEHGIVRYRVIDRQYHVYTTATVAIYPTGEVVSVDGLAPEALAAVRQQPGVLLTQRNVNRVRWTVTTKQALLRDQWSPYRHFTVIPYFPYFRRGRTRGMVDNAVSPQEVLNKAASQVLHVASSTANSGWEVEEDSLVNMEPDDLEDRGASTGLVVVYKKNSQKPSKIEPNQIPTGITQLIDLAAKSIKTVTGVNESMLGVDGQDLSGIAIQSRQFAAQQQLAIPLDNLSRTRHMVAQRCLELFQAYYSDERELRFTEMDIFGHQKTQVIRVNQAQPDGAMFNDLTIGTYDVAIGTQPLQITFDNSQFEQVMKMREKGVRIPDSFVVRYSNLADKEEVIQAMQGQDTAPQDPLAQGKAAKLAADIKVAEAKAALAAAQAVLAKANAVQLSVTGMYSATRAAAEVASMPQVAPVADEMLASAGFVDANAPPAIPEPGPGETVRAPPPSENTNPLTPPHPDRGADAGIETPGAP